MDRQRIPPVLQLKLGVDTEDGSWLEPSKIRLLELIAEHGSITAGAREMGISYRHAWLRIEAMSKGLGRPVLTTRPGGTGGGGASLTAGGNALIGCYRQLETDLQLATNVTLARLMALIVR